jgi:hypothetical protein
LAGEGYLFDHLLIQFFIYFYEPYCTIDEKNKYVELYGLSFFYLPRVAQMKKKAVPLIGFRINGVLNYID